MFNTVSVNIDKGKISIGGFLGIRILSRFIRSLGRKKVDLLFIKVGATNITFYEFFKFEVSYIFKEILDSKNTYGVNVRAIRSALEQLEEIVYEDTFIDKLLIEKELKYKPLPYQENLYTTYADIKKKMGYRGMLLDAKTGTGKTYMSLSLALALDSEKVVVVVPKEVYETVWVIAFTDPKEGLFLKDTPFWYVDKKTKYNNEKYIIMTYENLKLQDEVLKIIKSKYTTIIVEESHKFGSVSSQRTERLLEFLHNSNSANILPMSGTSVKSSSTEVSIIMEMIDSKYVDHVKKRFLKMYGKPSNLFKEMLPARFQSSSLLIKKEELGLPDPIVRYVKVNIHQPERYSLESIREDMKTYIGQRLNYYDKLKPEYHAKFKALQDEYREQLLETSPRDEYNIYQDQLQSIIFGGYSMDKAYMASGINKYEKKYLFPIMTNEDKKVYKNIAPVVKYVNLKVGGEALGNVVMKALIRCHTEMASVLDYKSIIESVVNKTVIFSSHIEVLEAAERKLKKSNYKHNSKVYGPYVKDMGTQVATFKNNKKVNNILATYNSLSIGTPLVEANAVILLNLPFRNYIYDQATARIWRGGQKEQTYIYIPILDYDTPNINSRNIDIIKYFKAAVEELTGRMDLLTLDGTTTDNLGEESLTPVATLNNLYAGKTLVDAVPSKNPIKIIEQWLNS